MYYCNNQEAKMIKFRKSDIVVIVILTGSWLFYLLYGGTTRFDLNQIITLPLLVAADFTALSILYAAGRYYTARKGGIDSADLSNLVSGGQAGQIQDGIEPENNKS